MPALKHPVNARWPPIVFVVLCAAPLLVATIGPAPSGRGFWVEFGVALGFLALGMLGAQFVLTARFPNFSRSVGQDTLLRFHRASGIFAAALVFAHPIVLIAADRRFAAFFDPRVNAPRALALTGVLAATVALIGLSVCRARWAIRYEWWRLTHAALAAFVMLVAIAHVVMVDHYSNPPARKLALVALAAAPLALLTHLRLVRPWLLRRRPWRVVSVEPETERVWTVTLEPDDHPGLLFRPGQFVWLTFHDTPFSLRQHPFTIASSADEPGRLRFTIKQLGDFTSTVKSIPAGTTAFVEGPAGSFVPPDAAPGVVFIAGGIGITPAMSIVRTAVQRSDQRPLTLFFATGTLAKAPFRDELARAARAVPLRIIHVPENPPDGWTGPSGHVDADLLRRELTQEILRTHHFMVCGPAPMMDAVEAALLELGVPRTHVRSERFDMI